MDEQTGSQRTSVWTQAEGALTMGDQSNVLQDQALWAAFAEALTIEAFCQSWLALQCRMMRGTQAGIILLGPPDRGPFRPMVAWPEGRHNLKHLSTTAEKTLADRRGVMSPAGSAEGKTRNDW